MNFNQTYREKEGEIIKGVTIPIFINNVQLHLSHIHIYEDGMIDCWGLTDYNGFLNKIKSGWIKTDVTPETTIIAFPLGNFEISKFYPGKTVEGLIKEVKGILDRYNGIESEQEICIRLFRKFLENPNKNNKEELKISYEKVPEHERRFLLGDMDVDDIPIRAIVYGSSAFNESHKSKIQAEFIKSHYLKGINIDLI